MANAATVISAILETSGDVFLRHYASKYYDPAKAREYYLRTRELKGRRSTTELKTDDQKQGWDYVKSEVGNNRKAELAKAAESNKQAVEELRAAGEERRKAISDKLREIMDGISATAAAENERISKEVEAKIARLPRIPKGISKERAAQFAELRRQEIAKIRGEAGVERESLGEAVTNTAASERSAAKQLGEEVKATVKASLEKARSDYESAKEEIKARYEAELDTEYEAIRTTVR